MGGTAVLSYLLEALHSTVHQSIWGCPHDECCFQVDIDTVEKFESLRATEQKYFTDMVQKCKDSGAKAMHA